MVDSAAAVNALIAFLQADAALTDLCPDGVFEGEATPGMRRFVLVVVLDENDVPIFGARGFEDWLVSVTAVMLQGAGGDVVAGAQRIDQLLDPQPPDPPATLTIDGYGTMLLEREQAERPPLEVDEIDPNVRWERRGGQYRLMATPTTA